MDPVALLGDRVIAYRPLLRTLGIASTVGGTLLASQLLWEYQQHGRQPFHLHDMELARRTGLTVDEVRTARADLTKRSGSRCCFTYKRRGFPPRGYWDVDTEALAACLSGKTQSGRQFGAEPETEPPIRAHARIDETPVAKPIRANGRHEATGPKPSQDSNSGRRPHQFGPSPESSLCKESLEENNPEKEGAPRGASAPPSPAKPPAAAPPEVGLAGGSKRQKPEQVPNPTAADLPPELSHCAEEFLEWWQVKPKGHSRIALKRAAQFLLRYAPGQRLLILEAATVGETQGLYPPRETRATGSGSRPVGGGRPSQADYVAAAIARVKAAAPYPSTAPSTGETGSRAIEPEVLP